MKIKIKVEKKYENSPSVNHAQSDLVNYKKLNNT